MGAVVFRPKNPKQTMAQTLRPTRRAEGRISSPAHVAERGAAIFCAEGARRGRRPPPSPARCPSSRRRRRRKRRGGATSGRSLGRLDGHRGLCADPRFDAARFPPAAAGHLRCRTRASRSRRAASRSRSAAAAARARELASYFVDWAARTRRPRRATTAARAAAAARRGRATRRARARSARAPVARSRRPRARERARELIADVARRARRRARFRRVVRAPRPRAELRVVPPPAPWRDEIDNDDFDGDEFDDDEYDDEDDVTVGDDAEDEDAGRRRRLCGVRLLSAGASRRATRPSRPGALRSALPRRYALPSRSETSGSPTLRPRTPRRASSRAAAGSGYRDKPFKELLRARLDPEACAHSRRLAHCLPRRRRAPRAARGCLRPRRRCRLRRAPSA